MSRPRKPRTKALKPIPRFETEVEERAFWATHDTAEYVDWRQARWATFPNLKPSTETISLRLPGPLLADLKALANKRDVPYQSLLKMFVAERVAREWASAGAGVAEPAPRAYQGARKRRAPKRA